MSAASETAMTARPADTRRCGAPPRQRRSGKGGAG
jgi:hypothetical protein